MFGFIRPVKGELKVKEAERFQQVYCGLCHEIQDSYGRFYTWFLSYDMTFYALMLGCDTGASAPACKKRCIASPLCGKACCPSCHALGSAADISVLLCYHKMHDSVQDSKGVKKLAAKLLCFFGRRGYRKAQEKCPTQDAKMRKALSDLQVLEREMCDSMDRAADASARLTAAMVPETGDALERVRYQMFYHIGRWLYLLDAAADVEEDMENGNYNPVILRYGLTKPMLDEVKETLLRTLERSLVEVCMAFDLLAPMQDEELLRNIIFLGMPVATKQVMDGAYQTNGGWGKHGSL